MLIFQIFIGVFAAELLMLIVANSLFDMDDDDHGPPGSW